MYYCGWTLSGLYLPGLQAAYAESNDDFFVHLRRSFAMEPSLSWSVSGSDESCLRLLLKADAVLLHQVHRFGVCCLASFESCADLLEELYAAPSCSRREIALWVSSFLAASVWSRWSSKPGMALSGRLASSSFLPFASTFSNQALHQGHLHQSSSSAWGSRLAGP